MERRHDDSALDHQWTLPQEMEEQPEYTAASEEVLEVTYGSLFAEGKASESARPVPQRQPRPRKKSDLPR